MRERIVEAYAFAAVDPYRAATHNKGIMNGVDAVVIATGNDWRAIEAGAHAYAARDWRIHARSRHWRCRCPARQTCAGGTLELPMAVGIVGGATRVHPTARAGACKIMGVAVGARAGRDHRCRSGLAQNLAALRALATEGIQRGHMALHARQVAMAAGATGDDRANRGPWCASKCAAIARERWSKMSELRPGEVDVASDQQIAKVRTIREIVSK